MPQISCRNILLSGQTGPKTNTPGGPSFSLPEHRADAAQQTIYRILVEGIGGDTPPTSAVLRARFQICQRTGNGCNPDGSINRDAVTDASPVWTTIDENSQPNLLPYGDWPTRLWRLQDYDANNPFIIERSIRGGCSNRLMLFTEIGGGSTNAGIRLTVESETIY